MPTVLPLTSLVGSVTLPGGIDFKVSEADCDEQFRVADGEGLEDEGFAVPQQTGRQLKAQLKGFMTAGDPGIANPNFAFQNVAFTIAFNGSANSITGNCCVSRFRAVAATGKLTIYECDFESVGNYTTGRDFPVS